MRHRFIKLYIDSFSLEQLSSIKPGFFIVTANMEQFVLVHQDDLFKKVVNSADLIIPDGDSLVLASRLFFKNKSIKKIAGIDLAEKLITSKEKIAFLGAKPEIIEILKKKFSEKIVFSHHGYFSEEQEKEIIEKIKESKAQLLLVALGSPKQEFFIERHRKNLDNSINIGVGGAFDVWAGKTSRAPKWMIDFHLEWFFRILREPYRIKRFICNVTSFLVLLASNLLDERLKK